MYHVVFSQMLISFALLAIVTAQFGPHGPNHGNPHFGPPGHRHRLLSAQRHSQLLQHALFISTPRPNRLQFGQPGVGFPRRPISAPIPTTTSSPVPPSSTQSPVQLNSVSPRPRPVTNNNLGGLVGLLNGGNFGSASAGGAGNGAVQNGAAIGQGTGIANVGPGGFGIGLGIGGAIATPLGNLAFGTGESLAVGKK